MGFCPTTDERKRTMKKYLMVEIQPITPELLERFKASQEWILAYSNGQFREYRYSFGCQMWIDMFGKTISQPTHYLPDGLPDPSAAVEVFEAEVYPSWDRDSEPMYEMYSEKTHEDLPYGTKLGVFKL
jgi:hypothetical protein